MCLKMRGVSYHLLQQCIRLHIITETIGCEKATINSDSVSLETNAILLSGG